MCEETKRCSPVPRASKLLGSPRVKLFQRSRGSESLLEVGEEKSWEAHAHSSLMFVSARIGGNSRVIVMCSQQQALYLYVMNSWNMFVGLWGVGLSAVLDGCLDWGQVVGGGRCKWRLDLTCAKNPATCSVVERT
jgi:hypothetical protein